MEPIMAKKNNKTKSKARSCIADGRGSNYGDRSSYRRTSVQFYYASKNARLFEDAENGDIRAQHELFADIEERDSDIAANMGTRKRAADAQLASPRREMRRPKKKSCPTKPTK